MRYRYNAVRCLQLIYNGHPIARPWGRDMGCLLWVKALINILPRSLQWWMHYRVLLHRVITALHCIFFYKRVESTLSILRGCVDGWVSQDEWPSSSLYLSTETMWITLFPNTGFTFYYAYSFDQNVYLRHGSSIWCEYFAVNLTISVNIKPNAIKSFP